MENCIPKCSCGANVFVEEIMVQVFEGDLIVDVKYDLYCYDFCGDCYDKHYYGDVAHELEIEDEMPF